MNEDPELALIESIYDALDEDDAEQALALAREALASADPSDPVLHYLAGRALLDLDRPREAAEELRHAVGHDELDPEFRTYLAWALFRDCCFDEGLTTIRGALDAPEPLPESHYVHALFLERAGRLDEAEREFRRASKIDPRAFSVPPRFEDSQFSRQLARATAALEERFRAHLGDVTVLVEDLPSEALLREEDPPLDPEQLLGLFCGVPLGQSSMLGPGGDLPPRIHLFKRNLERYSADADDLAEQIRLTLYHELGHYLGLEEDDLEELGYG